MDPKAIDAANVRLEAARKAVAVLQDKRVMAEQARMAWIEFLLAAGAIYSKLKAGAKGSPKSKRWLEEIEQLRETDGLLRYIHHARNAEEHGLDGSSHFQRMKLEALPGEYTKIIPATDGKPKRVIHRSTTEPVKFKITMAKLRLVAIKDRNKKTVPLPTTHLGDRLSSMSVGDLAALTLQYLEKLVADGSSLK